MQWATILGAIVTAASMVFGVLTYRRGAYEHRQAAAVEILQRHLELSLEHPELATPASGQPVDAGYIWFARHAMFTAEMLWSLVGKDRKWQGTIEFLLHQHRDYLQQGLMTCDAYQPEFLVFVRKKAPELACDKLAGG